MQIMRRPAVGCWRVTVHAAGVQSNRKIVFHRGFVNRPVVAPAQHHFTRRGHHDLDEPFVARATLDLLDREHRCLRRHDDRGAQARFLVQPVFDDPVVHGGTNRGAHGLTHRDLPASQRIADGGANAKTVECLRAHRIQAGSRALPRHTPVRAARQRCVQGVGHHVEAIQAAMHEGFPPERIHIRQQCLDVGHAGMNVAIDGGQFRHYASSPAEYSSTPRPLGTGMMRQRGRRVKRCWRFPLA